MTWPEISKAFRPRKSPPNQNGWVDVSYPDAKEELLALMQKVPLLVIDDLFFGGDTLDKDGRSRLLAAIEYRQQNNLATVITTNMSRADMVKVAGAAMVDRLSANVCVFAGDSLRKRNQKPNPNFAFEIVGLPGEQPDLGSISQLNSLEEQLSGANVLPLDERPHALRALWDDYKHIFKNKQSADVAQMSPAVRGFYMQMCQPPAGPPGSNAVKGQDVQAKTPSPVPPPAPVPASRPPEPPTPASVSGSAQASSASTPASSVSAPAQAEPASKPAASVRRSNFVPSKRPKSYKLPRQS